MSEVVATLAIAVATAGLFSFVVSICIERSVKPGLAIMLDLWVAAGLLRLSTEQSWESLATTAVLILVRKMVLWAWNSPTSIG